VKQRSPSDEIRKTVAKVIQDRALLRVAPETLRIARYCRAHPESVARELITAGIQARVNIEFGSWAELLRQEVSRAGQDGTSTRAVGLGRAAPKAVPL
jgi:hypothetical protein